MVSMLSRPGTLTDIGRGLLRRIGGWSRIVHLGALLMVLAVSPSSYTRAGRAAVAREISLGTAPILPWFTLFAALISLVLIRIVVVTAASYGLSQYALQMVVRVLVLELIPLTAAIFVALRVGLPDGREIGGLRARGEFDALRSRGIDPLRREVLPRVLAGGFAVMMLAAVASVVTLALAYLSVHGFTLGGLGRYTRTVGQVFSPAVTLIFTIKTFFLALAVSLIPVSSALYDLPSARVRTSAELQALVRLFVVMLLIEVASLVGNYYCSVRGNLSARFARTAAGREPGVQGGAVARAAVSAARRLGAVRDVRARRLRGDAAAGARGRRLRRRDRRDGHDVLRLSDWARAADRTGRGRRRPHRDRRAEEGRALAARVERVHAGAWPGRQRRDPRLQRHPERPAACRRGGAPRARRRRHRRDPAARNCDP
jgi:phospholipid/cholesterol/gamma-HCH transport system permease protein